jgi:hypothetical protein
MGKASSIGPGTEIGNMILQDFLDYKITGKKPWGKGVGGADHYKSREIYVKNASQSAFRTQARKIAQLALVQLELKDFDDKNSQNPDMRDAPVVQNSNNNANAKNDCEEASSESSSCISGSEDENEDNYDSSDDDDLSGFDDIELGELQNSREPFFTGYPTADKILAIFPLDGDVLDPDAHQFEFMNDSYAIRRMGKVPKERESCMALIGDGKEKPSKMGFSSVDLVVVDAEIKKRMRLNKYKRDENGAIWEVRATLQLPFKCDPHFRNREGQILKTFRIRSNKFGFTWVYFWLLAWKPPKPTPAKRIGGTLVTVMSNEDSSVFTEKTYDSKNPNK